MSGLSDVKVGWVRHRLRELAHLDLSAAESVLGCVTLAWGYTLLTDQKLFSLPIYDSFHRLHLTSAMLGALLAPVGAGLLVGLLSNRRLLRRLSLLGSLALWSFMAAAFCMAPLVGVSAFLSVIFAVHSMFGILSLRLREAITVP